MLCYDIDQKDTHMYGLPILYFNLQINDFDSFNKILRVIKTTGFLVFISRLVFWTYRNDSE